MSAPEDAARLTAPASAPARAPGDEPERLARLALNVITEPADPRVARLLGTFGPVELYDRLLRDTDLAGLRSQVAARLSEVEPVRMLERYHRHGIRFVVPGDPEWPASVDDLSWSEPVNRLQGPPLGLWVRGPLDLGVASRGSVAVVGSRSATSYGASVAGTLGARLAGAGVTVVSGAAFGIDQAAHRGALAVDGPSVAVLACGVDRAYPAAHARLLDHLAEQGCVVSELPPGCAPTRVRFLARNRLIAALTAGTVVVEAAIRSGALNTANWAAGLHRVVMGVPGPVTSAPSEGVHELLRQGQALLVTRPEHVLEAVAGAGRELLERPRAEETARDRLPRTDAVVLEAVPLAVTAPTRSIARAAGVAEHEARASLERLRDQGWVRRADGEAERWGRTPETLPGLEGP